MSPNNAKAD